MKIKEIQEEIVDEFAFFDDWMQRYEHMISLGKSLPLIDDANKTDEYLIKGCQSKLWLFYCVSFLIKPRKIFFRQIQNLLMK